MMKRFISTAALLGGLAIAVGGAAAAETIHADKPVKKGDCRVTEDLTFGGPDAPEAAQFYERIGSVSLAADAAGNIYVLDDGNCRVQVFGPDGKHRRTVGKEGGGPGEFKFPRHLAVSGKGHIAVFDMGQQRISVFSPDGSLLRDQVSGRMVEGMTLDDDGGMVLLYAAERGVEMEGFDPKGKSLWRIGQDREMEDGQVFRFGAAAVAARVARVGDSVFRAHEGAYRLDRVGSDGAVQATMSRKFDRAPFELPEPSGDEDGDGPRMVMITVEDDGGGGGADVNVDSHAAGEMEFDAGELRKHMPEFTADLRGVLAWPDGRVWLPTSEEDGDAMVVDEWSRDGQYLRRLTLPSRYDWLSVGADGHLYAVAHDDDDYPIIHRLRIEDAS